MSEEMVPKRFVCGRCPHGSADHSNSDNPDVFPCRVEGCTCKDFLEAEQY